MLFKVYHAVREELEECNAGEAEVRGLKIAVKSLQGLASDGPVK